MFRIIFAKIFFNGILFLSLNIYAQNFTTAVSGNFQSGYKIYDNYNMYNTYINPDNNLSTESLNLIQKELQGFLLL